MSHCVLEIDTGIIADNYRYLRDTLSPAECGAVVKADAYGIGATHAAPALQAAGCRHFFVAYLEEGIQLKTIPQFRGYVYVFNGLLPGLEEEFYRYKLIPVIHSYEMLERWHKFAARIGSALPFVLQVDTGMHKTGLNADDLKKLYAHPLLMQGIDMRYLMTHLACSDMPQHTANTLQLQRFHEVAKRFPDTPKSMAASYGIFLGREYHFDLARPGLALYGLSSCGTNKLRSCVKLMARILQIQTVYPPNFVGYGCSYEVKTPRYIATIACGYADGIATRLTNVGYVNIHGYQAPIVSRVTMDVIMVDISDIPMQHAQVNDWVTILDNDLTPETWCKISDGNPREFLFGMGPRVKRIYKTTQNAQTAA